MAQDTSGIMSLQEDYFSKGMLPPEMGLEVADGSMDQLNPQLRPAVDGLTSEISGQLADISDEELDQVIQLVQQLYDDPDNYPQNRAALIQSGELTEEDLPPQYDPEALAMMLYTLRKEKQARTSGAPSGSMPPMAGAAPAEMQPPQGFARGGIAEAARLVAGSGRYGDTMLAHINPEEAKLLRKHGGSGTINPKTGLPEFIFGFLRKIWQAVWKPVKKFLNTKIGKIVSNVALNILIPGYGSVIAAGLQTAAADGNFSDIIKNMAIAGVTSYLGGQIPGVKSPIQGISDNLAGKLGIESVVGKEAFLQGAVSTGAGLLQGQSLKDAATSGLVSAGSVVASSYLKDYKGAQQGAPAPGTAPIEEIDTTTGVRTSSIAPPESGIDITSTRSPYDYKTMAAEMANDPLMEPQWNAKPTTSYSADQYQMPSAATSTSGQLPINTGSSTSVAPPVTAAASTGFKPVSVGDAFSTMGRGAKQILTGDFSKGFDDLTQGTSDLFMPPSPDANQLSMRQNELMRNNPNLTATQAMDLAKGEAPGMIRTYGPGVAAGIGALALGGGFSPPEDPNAGNGPQMRGPSGEDLIKSDPNKYLVQGLPGVQYDAQGNIIGGNPAAYQFKNMQDVRVATPNYFQPRPTQFAMGGIAGLATGGYPRKTGQISGPGTETSDSIPAMLSDGEFVMTAKAVRGLGKGSRREGAKRMYALMHQLERNAARG